MASIGYIGSKGTRLRSGFSPVNAVPFEALKLGAAFLQLPLSDVTLAQRAYAQSVGVTLPTCDQVIPDFCMTGPSNTPVGFSIAPTVAQALKPFPQYGRITEHMESQGRVSITL